MRCVGGSLVSDWILCKFDELLVETATLIEVSLQKIQNLKPFVFLLTISLLSHKGTHDSRWVPIQWVVFHEPSLKFKTNVSF